jgi:1-acyl-sn-glycerol-3-phosphate acyltransferase
MDMVFFNAKLYLKRNRVPYNVLDRFIFKIWGFQTLMESYQCTTGSVDSLVKHLDEGNLVVVLPGGAREGFFSRNYATMWNNRMGFVKVATQAKCPIVPLFTANNRQPHFQTDLFYDWCKEFYNKKKIILTFVYFYVPVRMRAFVGEPIEYDEKRSPEELTIVVENRIREMIIKYQKLPEGFTHGLIQRFTSNYHVNNREEDVVHLKPLTFINNNNRDSKLKGEETVLTHRIF